jgi:hypothetical protein
MIVAVDNTFPACPGFNSMNKPDHWRQANPQDQLKAILFALEGRASNMQEGINVDKNYADILYLIKQLKALGLWLVPVWQSDPNNLEKACKASLAWFEEFGQDTEAADLCRTALSEKTR